LQEFKGKRRLGFGAVFGALDAAHNPIAEAASD